MLFESASTYVLSNNVYTQENTKFRFTSNVILNARYWMNRRPKPMIMIYIFFMREAPIHRFGGFAFFSWERHWLAFFHPKFNLYTDQWIWQLTFMGMEVLEFVTCLLVKLAMKRSWLMWQVYSLERSEPLWRRLSEKKVWQKQMFCVTLSI